MDLIIKPGSIVCGVDGSDDATRGLHWAAEQAALERRPLAVVAAAGLDQVGSLTWAGAAGSVVMPADELIEAVTGVAESAAAVAAKKHPELDIVAHGVLGDPAEVLTALSQRAHLVVLGSRGRGVLRSRLLGSVSAAVSRHADCPVVVCRPDAAGKVRKGVVVGSDGTPEGRPVLEFAFRAAAARGLPLTILHAFHDVLAEVEGPNVVWSTQASLDSEHLLIAESVAGFAEKYPEVHVDTQFARGFPSDCLAADSQRWNLIVVGRHPTDSLSRMLSPTVATSVLERAHTTVVVVPVPAATL